MASDSWKEITHSLQVLRDHLHGPLLVLCLILAVVHEGVPRALYLLASALLCVSLIRFRRVEENLIRLREELNVLRGLINEKTIALGSRLTEVGQRLDHLARDLGLAQQEIREAKRLQAVPPTMTKAREGLRIFSAMIVVVVISNAVVLLLGRYHLASYGEQLGAVIGRFEILESRLLPAAVRENASFRNRFGEEIRRVEQLCRSSCLAPATVAAAPTVRAEAYRTSSGEALPVASPAQLIPEPAATAAAPNKRSRVAPDLQAAAVPSLKTEATASAPIAPTPQPGSLQTTFQSYLPPGR